MKTRLLCTEETHGQAGGRVILKYDANTNERTPVLEVHDAHHYAKHVEVELTLPVIAGLHAKLQEYDETSDGFIHKIDSLVLTGENDTEMAVIYGTEGEPFRHGPELSVRRPMDYDYSVMLSRDGCRILVNLFGAYLSALGEII